MSVVRDGCYPPARLSGHSVYGAADRRHYERRGNEQQSDATTNAAADVGVTALPNTSLTDVADVINATLTGVSESRTSCMKQVSK